MHVIRIMNLKKWPEGVSDGLTLPCSHCGHIPRFDYRVDDPFWRYVVPKSEQQDVICLPCLDRQANALGLSVCEHIEEVQFTGGSATLSLVPAVCFDCVR